MKRLLGILAFLSAVSLITVAVLLYTQGVMFKASMLKLAFVNLAVTVVLSGFYLTKAHCTPKLLVKYSIWGLGGLIIGMTILVSYHLIPPKTSWHIVVGLTIIFITLIELQLIKWDKSKNILKVLGLITLLSNVFIAIYYLAAFSMESFGVILDITVIASVFSFLFSLILSRDKKSKEKLAGE